MYNQFHNPAVEERMSKSVFMQLEMAAGLRASFQHAAAREHRPAAQVLQRLMREYGVRQSCVDADAEAGAFDLVKRGACAMQGMASSSIRPLSSPSVPP
jgi:hypothetical protein